MLGDPTATIGFYWRSGPKEWRIQCWRWSFELQAMIPAFGTTAPTTIPLDEEHLESLLLAIRTCMLAMDPALEMTLEYGPTDDNDDQAAGREGYVQQEELF